MAKIDMTEPGPSSNYRCEFTADGPIGVDMCHKPVIVPSVEQLRFDLSRLDVTIRTDGNCLVITWKDK